MWSKEERLFIVRNAYKMSDGKLTEEINRFSAKKKSKAAVRKYRQRLGLKKEEGGTYKADED